MPRSIRPDPARTEAAPRSDLTGFRETPRAIVELFLGTFLRDVRTFFPACRIDGSPFALDAGVGALPELQPTGTGFTLGFELTDDPGAPGRALKVKLFNSWHRLRNRDGATFSARDRRLLRGVGAVLELRCRFILQWAHTSRLELNRGEPGDHYIAASVEPASYDVSATRPSRVAATILTLRTMALSTYENHRISTGALLLGAGADFVHSHRYRLSEAVRFGVDLTGLKSLHRLCDGRRSVFLVDQEGRLVDVVDIAQWASFGDAPDWRDRPDDAEAPAAGGFRDSPVPCARVYTPHALATRRGGHVCLVLSPNQEILVFAAGVQEFAFAHGRWRVLDPAAKFAAWRNAVSNDRLARVLFQTALDMAENRQGGLLVVATEPGQAIERLISPGDLLRATDDESGQSDAEPDKLGDEIGIGIGAGIGIGIEAGPIDPPAKRALHYLARGCSAISLDAPVLEALASLDGALVVDGSGEILAFGAILRHGACPHDPPDFSRATAVEGARTTAAVAASRFGPVLKISEDGVVSCFLGGSRAWDL